MDGTNQSRTDGRGHGRLLDRLDQMVESGRVTESEAERLRTAAEPGAVEDGVLQIRLRHAWSALDAAVQKGSLAPAEAGGFLERLRNGEDPGTLRAQLRGLRRQARPGAASVDQSEGGPHRGSPA